jgi:hypothetical protein
MKERERETYGRRRPLLVVSLAGGGLRWVLGRALGVVALVGHFCLKMVVMGELDGVGFGSGVDEVECWREASRREVRSR